MLRPHARRDGGFVPRAEEPSFPIEGVRSAKGAEAGGATLLLLCSFVDVTVDTAFLSCSFLRAARRYPRRTPRSERRRGSQPTPSHRQSRWATIGSIDQSSCPIHLSFDCNSGDSVVRNRSKRVRRAAPRRAHLGRDDQGRAKATCRAATLRRRARARGRRLRRRPMTRGPRAPRAAALLARAPRHTRAARPRALRLRPRTPPPSGGRRGAHRGLRASGGPPALAATLGLRRWQSARPAGGKQPGRPVIKKA
jgi:hypothetical protein